MNVAAQRSVNLRGRAIATDAEGCRIDLDDGSEHFARAWAREAGLQLSALQGEPMRRLRTKAEH